MRLLLACFLLAVAVPTSADPVRVGAPVAPPWDGDVGAIAYYQWLAVEFTISANTTVSSVFVGIDASGAPYSLRIADSLTGGTTFWSAGETAYDPLFSASFSLSPGAYYLIASSMDVVNGWRVSDYTLVQQGGIVGGMWLSGNLGVTWGPLGGYVPQFEISGDTAVPEPASLLLLGAGLVGLRAWRRRRS